MKKVKMIFTMFLVIAMVTATSVVMVSCDDDDEPGALTVESITASGTDLESGDPVADIDLYGATAASNVPLDATIIVTFNKAVDASTVSATTVTVTGGATNPTPSVSTSGNTVTITFDEDLSRGIDYTLTVASGVKASDGGTLGSQTSATFRTAGRADVTPPQAASQIAYWNFDGSADATAGEFATEFAQVAFESDRFGYANSAALFRGATAAGNGDIIEIAASDALVTPSRTITVWFKVDENDYSGSRFLMGMAVERGFFIELGSDKIAWLKLATNHALDPDPMGHGFGINWSDPNGDGAVGGQIIAEYQGSISDLITDDEWHQLALTYDAATSMKTIYLDGAKLMQIDIDSETTEWYLKNMAINDVGATDNLDTKLTFGYAGSRANTITDWARYSNAQNTYKGLMDDVRIFSVALTESEIQTLYNAEKP